MKKVLLSTLFIGLSFLGFSQDVDLTFHVNMNNQTVDPGGVFIAGGSGFGVPGDNEMTDPDGDGVYSITLTRPENFSSHYIFTNGNCPSDWSCKEQIGGQSCADPNNFNDRFISVGVNDTTVSTCFSVCSTDTSCVIAGDSVNITINVNMNNEVVDPGGVYLAGGGNFGVPGDNEMLDPDGDGVYSITVRKLEGFSSFYTFTNGACSSDWACKEDIIGQSCADPNNFNDRHMMIGSNDTTINTCFAVCSTDTSCTGAPVPVNVTFRVNMSAETVDSSGVFIGASFDGWSGGLQMMDIGNGTYEYTASLNPNSNYEWKFINGANWATPEEFDPATMDSTCTLTTGENTNRFLALGADDIILEVYLFNSCDMFIGINDLLVDKNLFSLQPNRTKDRTNIVFNTVVPETRQVEIIDISGRKMLATEIAGSELRHSLQLGNLAPGMYFVMVRQETKVGMQKLIIMN